MSAGDALDSNFSAISVGRSDRFAAGGCSSTRLRCEAKVGTRCVINSYVFADASKNDPVSETRCPGFGNAEKTLGVQYQDAHQV
jgi:hypothetical protein